MTTDYAGHSRASRLPWILLAWLLGGNAPLRAQLPAALDFDSGYSAWIGQHQLSADSCQPAQAAAGDGVPNLIKYAMGLDPNVSLSQLPWRIATTSERGYRQLVLEGPKSPGATGVEWRFEKSSDLREWTAANGALTPAETDGAIRFVEAGDPGAKIRFLRVRFGVQRWLLGPESSEVRQTLPASGGTLQISDPEHPLHGLTISVPAGALAAKQEFRVSSRAIEAHAWGAKVVPITPLIKIDTGGQLAGQLMTVSIPIRLPDNHFALAFIYDDQRNTLEGVPLVSLSATEIQVATRHFSELFVSMINRLDLPTEADSGFRPGVDDWEFVNEGSMIAPMGHCTGQCLSAMWYFLEKRRQGAPPLNNAYDNHPWWWKTPDFNRDNVLGYRLASQVQKDVNFNSLGNQLWTGIDPGDSLTYDAFLYSLHVTQEPQEIGIYSDIGGHDMIIFKAAGNVLWVADPNYPGNQERRIQLDPETGAFAPYSSALNATEPGVNFTKFRYYAKTTTVDWNLIGQRWRELEAETVGTTEFLNYRVGIFDTASGQLLGSLPTEPGSYAELSLTNSRVTIKILAPPGIAVGARVFDAGGRDIAQVIRPDGTPSFAYDPSVDLRSGTNGFAVEARSTRRWAGLSWIWLVRPGNPLDWDSYVWPGDLSRLIRHDFENGGFLYTTPEGIWEGPYISYQDGALFEKGYFSQGNDVGPHVLYWPNGNPRTLEFFVEGQLDGPCQTFYESGPLESEQCYAAGLNVGTWFFYREDGTVESKREYLEPGYGRETTFHPNGGKLAEGFWRELGGEWKPVGVWTYFDEQGEVTRTEEFGDGNN